MKKGILFYLGVFTCLNFNSNATVHFIMQSIKSLIFLKKIELEIKILKEYYFDSVLSPFLNAQFVDWHFPYSLVFIKTSFLRLPNKTGNYNFSSHKKITWFFYVSLKRYVNFSWIKSLKKLQWIISLNHRFIAHSKRLTWKCKINHETTIKQKLSDTLS